MRLTRPPELPAPPPAGCSHCRASTSTRPVIFLDIDGVLNSVGSAIAFGTYRRFSHVSMGILRRLVERTNADIVISSSWRVGSSLDDLRKVFAENDPQFPVARIVDVTPRHSLKPRGFEVDAWLAANGARTHVIFDDDGDFDATQPLVKTNNAIGLAAPHYFKACKILGVPA